MEYRPFTEPFNVTFTELKKKSIWNYEITDSEKVISIVFSDYKKVNLYCYIRYGKYRFSETNVKSADIFNSVIDKLFISNCERAYNKLKFRYLLQLCGNEAGMII